MRASILADEGNRTDDPRVCQVRRRCVAAGQDHLQRHLVAQLQVSGAVDDAHAAASQYAQHLVTRNAHQVVVGRLRRDKSRDSSGIGDDRLFEALQVVSGQQSAGLAGFLIRQTRRSPSASGRTEYVWAGLSFLAGAPGTAPLLAALAPLNLAAPIESRTRTVWSGLIVPSEVPW